MLSSRTFRPLVPIFVFSALFNVLLLTTPLYIIQVYQRILTSQSVETLAVITVAAGLALAFAAAFDSVRRAILQRVGSQIYTSLGESVVSASLNSSLNLPSGERPVRDVETIRRFVEGRDILSLMDAPFTVLFIGLLFIIHPVVGGVALAMACLLLVLAVSSTYISSRRQMLMQGRMRQSADEFGSFITNNSLISSLGMSTPVIMHWMKNQLDLSDETRETQLQTTTINGVSQIIRMSTQIIVIGVAAYVALQGELNPGMIFASSLLAARAVAPIDGVIIGQQQFRAAREAYARLKRLLSVPPQQVMVRHVPKTGNTEVRNLVYVTPGSGRGAVLRGVNFKIDSGEIIALVGPSGSGKSTLGRALVGGLVPTSGSIHLDGVDLRNCDRDTIAPFIGYLPQETDILPGTIAQNIARFREADPDRVWEAVMLMQVSSEIGQLQQRLDTPMYRAAQELPAGAYRRLLLARAFFGSPKLIVLDEPSMNLDIQGEQALAETLTKMRDAGSAIVMISPRGNLITRADKIAVLKGGVIESVKDREEQQPGAIRQFGAPGGGVRLIAE